MNLRQINKKRLERAFRRAKHKEMCHGIEWNQMEKRHTHTHTKGVAKLQIHETQRTIYMTAIGSVCEYSQFNSNETTSS